MDAKEFPHIGIRRMAGTAAAGILFLTFAISASAQEPVSPPDDSPYRTEPAEPFQIIGNIYAVGETLHLINYLITTPEGHILIDAGYEESVPRVRANIEKLGFRVEDIRMLVASHAHSDHVAGFALLKELSGAEIVAGRRDVEVIETGGEADFRGGGERQWRPAMVDIVVGTGDQIGLGGTVLTAYATPGHTKGCTTWTMAVEEGGRLYEVIFFCGANIAAEALPVIGNPRYPEMADDFAASFAIWKDIPVDVYLGGHGYWFWIEEKLARAQQGGGPNPFIDPEGYRNALAVFERRYLDLVTAEGGR